MPEELLLRSLPILPLCSNTCSIMLSFSQRPFQWRFLMLCWILSPAYKCVLTLPYLKIEQNKSFCWTGCPFSSYHPISLCTFTTKILESLHFCLQISFPLSSWTNISWAFCPYHSLKQILSNFSDSLLPHLPNAQTPNLPDLSASFDKGLFSFWKNFHLASLFSASTGISQFPHRLTG